MSLQLSYSGELDVAEVEKAVHGRPKVRFGVPLRLWPSSKALRMSEPLWGGPLTEFPNAAAMDIWDHQQDNLVRTLRLKV
jgi:hypothetical protein